MCSVGSEVTVLTSSISRNMATYLNHDCQSHKINFRGLATYCCQPYWSWRHRSLYKTKIIVNVSGVQRFGGTWGLGTEVPQRGSGTEPQWGSGAKPPEAICGWQTHFPSIIARGTDISPPGISPPDITRLTKAPGTEAPCLWRRS